MVAATQRPSSDIIPTSLRDLFGYRWAFRCTTDASSDVILGHGWANRGYTAASIDPAAHWMWYQPGGIADAFHSTGMNTFRAYLIFRIAAEDLPPPPK